MYPRHSSSGFRAVTLVDGRQWQPCSGNGDVAEVYPTYEEACEDRKRWEFMLRKGAGVVLGIESVECNLKEGSVVEQ